MAHKYRTAKPTEWHTVFECKICGKSRTFVASAGMTPDKLNDLDKTVCVEEHHIDEFPHGVSGTTPVFTQAVPGLPMVEARMGIAIMGGTQMSMADIRKYASPFHPEWQDNFVQGYGATQEEAIDNLKFDLSKTADMLWA